MRVVISAGGTGGHIYPALSIIDKIKKEDKNSEFLYIGTTNRMEKDLIPKRNIPYVGIEVYGIKRSLSPSNIKSVYKFLVAIRKCKKELKKFKPDIVIGAGGYVTAPVIIAAKKLGIKTLIHEQNSVLGLANKMVLNYTDTLCTSFENVKPDNVNYVFTGNPVLQNALDAKTINKKEYGLSDKKKTVLIVMGSLGSKSVNEIILDSIDDLSKKDYEVLIVTGNNYYDDFKSIKKDNIIIKPYIDNLVNVIKSVDIVVTRAGASTLTEIIGTLTPAILIPSPYVTENHQYKNALSLTKKNSAILIKEEDLDKDMLIKQIDYLISDKNKVKEIKNNLSKLQIKDSSDRIYKEIVKLVNRK